MALLALKDINFGFGGPMLLDRINLQIERGERICLVGRNGTGKSTLLKLLNGDLTPDSGTLTRTQALKTAFLPQEVPADLTGSIYDVVAGGVPHHASLLMEYQNLASSLEASYNEACFDRIHHIQHELEAAGAWAFHHQIRMVISRMDLDPEADCAVLSAGMKRRTLFARALVAEPDILLLDEPTNHLDIESILWMEDFILRYVKTLLFVTHDRAFLKKLATRILELDRGRLFSYACDYGTFLKRRQAVLEAEENQNDLFDKKLSQEEAWIRQGIKARRTRNEGRVQALIKMREAFQARRGKIGNVKLQIQEAERTGKLVIEAKGVTFAFEELPWSGILPPSSCGGTRWESSGPTGPARPPC